MNEVTIIVPEWVVWLFSLAATLSLIDSGLKIYIHILRKRLEKGNG